MKPRVIRFFRNAMFNMVSLALKDLKVRVVPSRSTNALYSWLDQRYVPAHACFRVPARLPMPFHVIQTLDTNNQTHHPCDTHREQDVYSQMSGYDPTMRDSSDVFGLREPEIMPDGLMGDKVRRSGGTLQFMPLDCDYD